MINIKQIIRENLCSDKFNIFQDIFKNFLIT